MKEEKIKKGISEIKEIVMTDVEKKRIFDSILNNKQNLKKSIKSPWSFYAFISISHKSQMVYYIIIPLFIILSSSGVVFASQDSLPDSFLYPLKVKVIEPLEGVLTFSPEAKAKYESNLATTRLIEAETLAKQGKLNLKEEQKINKLIEDHTLSLNKALNKIDNNNLKENKDKIIINFRAQMNAHAKVLDIIKKEEKNNNNIINNQNDEYIIQTSEMARQSAEKIKEISKNDEVKISEKYNERKEETKIMIDNANKNLDFKAFDKSEINKSVINDTHNTLDEATQSLEKSNIKEQEGDNIEAYKALMDSESSIKEADILIKSGLNIKNKNNIVKNKHEDN